MEWSLKHGTGPHERPSGLITASLAAVETVEAHLFPGAQQWPFSIDERVAIRVDGPPHQALDLHRLADPLARTTLAANPETVIAASNSAVVVSGKLASGTLLKARAYLLTDGHPVTLKVWQAAEGAPSLGQQERAIRHELRAMPVFPAPPVIDDGRVGASDYVVEPVIYGRHPWSASARVDAALDLVPALAGAWRSWGPVDQALGSVFDTGLWKRLRRVLRDPTLDWDPSWGSRGRMIRTLWWLVQRNRDLPCAPAHGDLVTTNIIQEPSGRHLLVDWEHGRQMPIAFDLAKLLLTSGQPQAVSRQLRDHLEPFGNGRSRYDWHQQLALGLARMLSWSQDRRARAVTAGRVGQFDAERTAQLSFLVALLHDR